MVIFNVFISLMCLWLFVFLYNQYSVPANYDKYIYKLLSLEENLFVMIIENKISSKSKEYNFLINLINSFIKILKNFEIVSFIKELRDINKNDDEIDSILLQIHNHSSELNLIALGCYNIIYEMISVKKIRLFIWIIGIFHKVSTFCKPIMFCKSIALAEETFNKSRVRVERIRNMLASGHNIILNMNPVIYEAIKKRQLQELKENRRKAERREKLSQFK